MKFSTFGTFSIWKNVNIIPIRKSREDPPLARSYGSLSLLPALGKITQHPWSLTRLQKFYTDKPQQFDFRSKNSTSHQLLWVFECIPDVFDNSENLGAIFLHFVKTFDAAWHCGLIKKMIKLKFTTTKSTAKLFEHLR